MCRILGLFGSRIDYSLLRDFQNLALIGKIRAGMTPGHQDGWGMAGFQENKAFYFSRSKRSANNDLDYELSIEKAWQLKISSLVLHIRKASSGGVSLENTHPFIRDNWVFCHNGTINEASKIPLKQLKPEGTTDSERFFLFLVEKLSGASTQEEIKSKVKEAVEFIKDNFDYTSLTFLLCNNRFLVAYRSFNEKSEERNEYAGYYTLYYFIDRDFMAVCSEPIADLKFTAFNNEQLLIKNLA